MGFIDRLHELKDRFTKIKESVHTEEASKNAFIMPFIAALGYDVFNPLEIVPEFTADLGIKKGEKIDYCILKDNTPIIIIECKHWTESLDVHKTQLHRYFHVTSTRFGLLTNGIVYKFYTDLDETNKMDDKPFLEFSFENFNESSANELKKFQKELFDVDSIVNTASDLKYSKQIREILSAELKEPSEEFVKYFASRVYSGRITQKVLEQFTELVKKSGKNLISEMISDRLRTALDNEVDTTLEEVSEFEENLPQKDENGVVTTEEETEAFNIIKAILRKVVSLDRIFARDTKSYFGVLLDDNNRKPICRLHFNFSSKKYLGVLDADKKEERLLIDTLDNIYDYADKIRETVLVYVESEE